MHKKTREQGRQESREKETKRIYLAAISPNLEDGSSDAESEMNRLKQPTSVRVVDSHHF